MPANIYDPNVSHYRKAHLKMPRLCVLSSILLSNFYVGNVDSKIPPTENSPLYGLVLCNTMSYTGGTLKYYQMIYGKKKYVNNTVPKSRRHFKSTVFVVRRRNTFI